MWDRFSRLASIYRPGIYTGRATTAKAISIFVNQLSTTLYILLKQRTQRSSLNICAVSHNQSLDLVFL